MPKKARKRSKMKKLAWTKREEEKILSLFLALTNCLNVKRPGFITHYIDQCLEHKKKINKLRLKTFQ